VSKAAPQEIPDQLDLVIDFVNTLDVEAGTDELDTPAGLSGWLSAKGLLRTAPKVASERERAAAVDLREALRELMLANNGAAQPRAADWEVVERAAREGRLGVHFDAGAVETAPGADGHPGALARVLSPVAAALADGTWPRVKACRADDCTWAFYDRSRNRSGVWCEMSVCGNRHKVRAYRSRAPRSST
jgi:predicted RNA-binding Zn ribbon-like protein